MGRMVEDLLRPEAYPEGVDEVELIETDVSYIFLTGKYAYKVKKPVKFGLVDFTTPTDRRDYCHRELWLNRRLSPEVYVAVVEVREQDGSYAIEGPGPTVDWAVKMLQLPRDRAMSVMLERGQVTEEDVRRVAARIAEFHARVETSLTVARLGGLEAVRQRVEENFSQTERFVGVSLPPEILDDLKAYCHAFLTTRVDVFFQRHVEGMIRDCHGDLHTEQVFLENGISVIGCVEFNDRFRYSDVAEDVAFLAMDLEHRGRRDLSRVFVESYVQTSGDWWLLELLDFFKAYRAYVRGNVASARLDDPLLQGAEREEAESFARGWFRLAHSYATVRFLRTAIILVAGVTGDEKSAVAQDLARRWDLAYVSSDMTGNVQELGLPDEQRYREFDQGMGSPEASRRGYDAILERAEEFVDSGRSVVLDAAFLRSEERTRALELASRKGVDVWFVECALWRGKPKRRFNLRWRRGESVPVGQRELFHRQQAEWEPVENMPANRYIRLETGGPLPETMARLLHRLYVSVLTTSSGRGPDVSLNEEGDGR